MLNAGFEPRVSGTKPPADRLNYRWSSKNKTLNSTTRPSDQWAFNPFDPTASWLSHVALAIYMFAVNFDALAQASDIRIERRQFVFLCWMQDSNPGSQTDSKSTVDWMLDSPSLWSASIQPTVFTMQSLQLLLETVIHVDAYLWHYQIWVPSVFSGLQIFSSLWLGICGCWFSKVISCMVASHRTTQWETCRSPFHYRWKTFGGPVKLLNHVLWKHGII